MPIFFQKNQSVTLPEDSGVIFYPSLIPVALNPRLKMVLVGCAMLMNLSIGQAATTTATPNLYKVQAGDTLLGVANKFHISVKQLAEDNKKKTSDKLVRNELLILPSNLATIERPTSKSGIDKPQLKSSNSTTKNPFYEASQKPTNAGNVVAQPINKPAKTTTYTIKSGDSLTALAKKYNTTVNSLQQLNPTLKTTDLIVGKKLIVPAINSMLAVPAKLELQTPTPPQTMHQKIIISTYTVNEGDTLTAIANRYHLSLNDIAKINQILPDTAIKVGQTLMIPVNKPAQTALEK